jgi:hypothetical protein
MLEVGSSNINSTTQKKNYPPLINYGASIAIGAGAGYAGYVLTGKKLSESMSKKNLAMTEDQFIKIAQAERVSLAENMGIKSTQEHMDDAADTAKRIYPKFKKMAEETLKSCKKYKIMYIAAGATIFNIAYLAKFYSKKIER